MKLKKNYQKITRKLENRELSWHAMKIYFTTSSKTLLNDILLKRKYICEFQVIIGMKGIMKHYEGIVSYINNNEKVLIEWVEKRIVENNNNITFGGFMIIKFKTDRG